MELFIPVNYKVTSNAYTANQFIREIAQYPTFAWDFEAAIRYTPEQLQAFRDELALDPSKKRRIQLESYLNATALGHPSHCTITHCSIAVSESEAYVFILDNTKITNRILNFLITTPQRQILHNASYDFRHLHYHTGKMPLLYEDTQILAKTILNHVENHKANTGLKELAGKWYGTWGIDESNFTLEHMYSEKMLRYSAIDACSTYKLWTSINNYIKEYNATISNGNSQ